MFFKAAGQDLSDQPGATVFESGKEGYKSFRIPAIITAPNGHLLAFAEGRVNGSGDFGHINIVMKESSDQGRTWSPVKVVAESGKLQAGNPAPVVDLMDPRYPKGRILLFYNTGNNHEGEVRKKNGYREVWYTASTDNGRSWSEPVNITGQTSKINQPGINAQWNHPEDWRSYANTPGHGMQIQKGPYKGRIYIAANHSEGDPKANFEDYVAHGFYSDDHGQSFKISENVPVWGSNESTAAELSGGRLMFNSRNQKGDIRQRIVALSSDGGATWDSCYFDPQLPDPVCQGTILTLQHKSKGNILAFCNDASSTGRDSLTLRISYDDGKTWKKAWLLAKKGSAYSDITTVGKKSVGVLYEADGYRRIVFKTVRWR